MIPQVQVGDLVVTRVDYRAPDGTVKGKTRPLIIISRPNSKGDLLTIVGSTKLHQWLAEPHVVVHPETVTGGCLDAVTIFPASKQVLINQAFIKVKIGRISSPDLDRLMRICVARHTEDFFEGIHKPTLTTPFIPGKSRIPYAGRVYDEKEMIHLVDASMDFWLTTGRYAEEFEKKFAAFLGVKHCSLTNSGSSANLLAFMALTSSKLGERRIKQGDEVITVAAGFPTTVAPIIQYGAVPVFLDVELPFYNIDCTQLESAVSDKTKAVMLAHTLGNPFDLQAVRTLCDRHNLWLIEDNCDALGSKYFIDGEWKYTGTIGDLGTSSFYPPHHMTMGEGGAVYTNDKTLKRLVESFRDWGRDCWCPSGRDNTCGKRFERKFGDLPLGYDHKYVYSHFGYNLKVTDMQAAIGCAQLDKLPGFIEARKMNWKLLRDALADLSDYFILPEPAQNSDPSWFGFLLTVREDARFTRDQIVAHLEAAGVQTRMLFAGNITKHPCFDEMRMNQTGYRVVTSDNDLQLPVTDTIMKRSFWLGIYPGMQTSMMVYIAEQIVEFCTTLSGTGK